MGRNSKIYLAKNIKMDKNYKSVLGYTESQMLNLITDNNNFVYYNPQYSFIRERGTIKVDCPYGTAIQSNYMAFQNSDYSNKYFFAFIDEVKYLSDNSSEIVYTVDVWTTWWEYWNPKACFVVREHVIDDTVGSNTVPENIELGEYVCEQPKEEILEDPLDYTIIFAVTGFPSDNLAPYRTVVYNGIASGLYYFAVDRLNMNDVLRMYALFGRNDYIYSIFMCPQDLPSIWGGTSETWTVTQGSTTITASVTYLTPSNYSDNLATLTGVMPTGVGKRTPINKKLFTYPYSYMILDNHTGISQPFYYEDFKSVEGSPNIKEIKFRIFASIGIGMSMKAVPLNYKYEQYNYEYGISLAKIPVCSWISDAFTNYLTQNSMNFTSNLIGAGAQLLQGKVAGGVSSIMNSVSQIYQHAIVPNQSEGNLGSSDINFSMDSTGGLSLLYMSVRPEYSLRIDQYFTRMGYAVNSVKIPNMSYRENYNYVQIASEENLAYPNNHNNICLPATALDQINTLFRNGITIWNNHENFGDYSVSNLNTYS